jgi:hypothetical protein
VRYRQSVVPVLDHEAAVGETKLRLATLVCGRVGKDSLATLMGLVTEFDWTGPVARLRFHDGEAALVQLADAGDVQATLNGKKLAGPIVMARVSADGNAWFVLMRDGTVDRKGELA